MHNKKRRQVIINIGVGICVLGLAVIGLCVQFSQPDRTGTELYLENRTRTPVYFVYVTSVDRSVWNHDLLHGDVLLPDESMRVRLPEQRAYRIRAVDSRNRELDGGLLEPARTHTVVFTEDLLVISDQPERGLGWFTIHNYTSVPLQYVYVSPVYADHWTDGKQLLNTDEVLLPYDSMALYIDTEKYQTMVFDMLVEDSAGNRYIHWNVNIQLNPEVPFRIQDIR